MEIDCQSRSVDRYIKKVKKRKRPFYMGWLKCLPFLSGRVMINFIVGVNFTFGLLDCGRYIGDIVIQWIVKPGSCSIHFIVTLA